jgi:K+-sensing histidine kinase KdpD
MKKDQSKIFETSKSDKKNNFQGVGLGLAVSKLIVNKFNGKIDFISKFRKGSTFFFTFEIEEVDLINKEYVENTQNYGAKF